MFCKNCGSNFGGMEFCNKCVTKIENTDTVITEKAETKTMTKM